jgi:hypothetical protein
MIARAIQMNRPAPHRRPGHGNEHGGVQLQTQTTAADATRLALIKTHDEPTVNELAARLAISEHRIRELQTLLGETTEKLYWCVSALWYPRSKPSREARELSQKARRTQLALPDDDTLLAVVRTTGGDHVSASAVADRVFYGAGNHTDRIRIGKALSRLAREGRIVLHPATSHRQAHYSERTEATP